MDTKNFKSFFPTILSGELLLDSLLDTHFNVGKEIPHRVEETERGWEIEIPLAGVSRKDIKTKISDRNKLVVEISGDSKWHSGQIKRFSLPNSCDLDKISAKYEDGILTLTLPKAESFRERVVELK